MKLKNKLLLLGIPTLGIGAISIPIVLTQNSKTQKQDPILSSSNTYSIQDFKSTVYTDHDTHKEATIYNVEISRKKFLFFKTNTYVFKFTYSYAEIKNNDNQAATKYVKFKTGKTVEKSVNFKDNPSTVLTYELYDQNAMLKANAKKESKQQGYNSNIWLSLTADKNSGLDTSTSYYTYHFNAY